MTGRGGKQSKNTSTGLQSLQELEYFNVSNDPELPSAPEKNVIGIIKISSHQSNWGHCISSGISEAFTGCHVPTASQAV